MARVSIAAIALLAIAISVGVKFAAQSGNAADEKPPPVEAADSPRATEKSRPEFQAAGVCARCHVFHVLEWGISKHVAAETNCQSCHGPSRAHVANERNEVAPDRLPRGAEIAKLCARCHDAGCPKTLERATCEKCHHPHGLIDPAHRPAAEDDRLRELFTRWDTLRARMQEGDRLIERRDWRAARKAFAEGLSAVPGHHDAHRRMALCDRRLNPSLPGFEIVGDEFDEATGLPMEVRIAEPRITMRLVAPGEVDFGADRFAGASPIHTVRIKPFYLAIFELTQREWQQVMGTNPSHHQGAGFPDAAQMPVENISWDDCQDFLRRLNGRIPGGGFRLPTEAEWESAAREERRGGAPGENYATALERAAWYRENSAREPKVAVIPQPGDALFPRPVGTKLPNRWGLFDMQGNVAEWCSSLWAPYPYCPTDSRENLEEGGLRVIRGGGFADGAESLDPSFRHAERPQRALRWNGMRLARGTPEPALLPKAPAKAPVQKGRTPH